MIWWRLCCLCVWDQDSFSSFSHFVAIYFFNAIVTKKNPDWWLWIAWYSLSYWEMNISMRKFSLVVGRGEDLIRSQGVAIQGDELKPLHVFTRTKYINRFSFNAFVIKMRWYNWYVGRLKVKCPYRWYITICKWKTGIIFISMSFLRWW
jgi:hypothetical protein